MLHTYLLLSYHFNYCINNLIINMITYLQYVCLVTESVALISSHWEIRSYTKLLRDVVIKFDEFVLLLSFVFSIVITEWLTHFVTFLFFPPTLSIFRNRKSPMKHTLEWDCRGRTDPTGIKTAAPLSSNLILA